MGAPVPSWYACVCPSLAPSGSQGPCSDHSTVHHRTNVGGCLKCIKVRNRVRSVGSDSARCHVSRQRALSTIDLVRPLRCDVQALNIPVARFLNRILGLRLELQNEVFSYFSQAFHSACGEGSLSAAFSLWFAGVTR